MKNFFISKNSPIFRSLLKFFLSWKWSLNIIIIWNKNFFDNRWVNICQIPDEHLFIINLFSWTNTFIRNGIVKHFFLQTSNLRKLISLKICYVLIITNLFKLLILKRFNEIINLRQAINQANRLMHLIQIILKILKHSLKTAINLNLIPIIIKNISDQLLVTHLHQLQNPHFDIPCLLLRIYSFFACIYLLVCPEVCEISCQLPSLCY